MPFISYAQNYEDVMLWRALRDVEQGFYVDVGAADAQDDSVTNAFYERGWSGINIEPLDEYFAKLTQARPRDTNLKVAVGRQAGVRALHAFPGTGLSTLDGEIGARHRAAGFSGSKLLVPVMTLTKILGDCAPAAIHFLKIDVEGSEAEVLEGLNLERFRPWVIVIEANQSNSTLSSRADWEHLVTGRGYGLAYFDGLNCFYVADEVAPLKDRLAVPPNVFDDFIRFPEWAIRQQAADLERQVVDLQGQASGLIAAWKAEHVQSASLRLAMQEREAQNAILQARQDHLLQRVRHLDAELAVPSVDRAIGRAFRRLKEMGDRVTGGGVRSLVRRALITLVQLSLRKKRLTALGRALLSPFPKGATTLYQVAKKTEASGTSSMLTPGGSFSSDDPATAAALPPSARPTYLRLKTAISRSGTWHRTP